ncbi:MAG: response regulator transcription factor, partial [Spirochaetales bacterium]
MTAPCLYNTFILHGMFFPDQRRGFWMKISIIICDDEDLFREGLHLLIEKNGQYKVLGEADNGQDLLELLSGLSRQGVTADLVLMDVEMPVMKGTDAARRVREISPSTRIIG